MRVLIDILHPAHVHFFKIFRAELLARGHEVMVTARDKDVACALLDNLGIPYALLSRQRTGAGLGIELLSRTAKLIRIARRFRPDAMTGIMGPSIALAGRLLGIPAVVFYDTEFAVQTNWFTYPLAHSVCTPDCYQGKVNGRHVTYPGYHELAYLHPSRFTPDPGRLAAFGVSPEAPYAVVRFVAWEAIHDINEVGLTLDRKRTLIETLRRDHRVVIASEGRLPADLEGLRATGPVEDMHHLMAFARVLVGESATMASEAAVLGVPALFIAKTGRGYTDDEERRYGLVSSFRDTQFDDALSRLEELLRSDPRAFGQAARQRLLADKIDVTGWMLDYFDGEFG